MSKSDKPAGAEAPVLDVEDLTVDFDVRGKSVNILAGLDFKLAAGETLGIIGESGCGKSMTALALLRMVPSPPGSISRGRVLLNGEDLLTVSKRRMNAIRGKEISMIFQEPMTSLNPVYSVGDQISETIRRHTPVTRAEAFERSVELLRTVQIPAPERRILEYPHQLSGGMRQRVMLAMALACDPKVLIADEPTTALDVTVQAQIFDLLKELQANSGTSIILITHDFGAITEMADRVLVMYAGHKVEEGSLNDIRTNAAHPYTQGLLRSMPKIRSGDAGFRAVLPEIPGAVPDLSNRQPGCPFGPRCAHAMPACHELPPDVLLDRGGMAKCWLSAPESAS